MNSKPTASHSTSAAPRRRAAATFAANVKLEKLSRQYGEATALDGIDLTVDAGEIVCLLGPSGCGKTTLLRVISGIERPSSGRVLINDREVAGPDRFDPPEIRGVGLMFQDFALFPHLSVLDNVAFGLKTLSPPDRKTSARAILDRVGLTNFADAFPSTLSGGQQQRVALARAIVPRPAVMLMDEPFSGLDVQLRDQMQEETLSLLRETRATSLIVTHHPEEAMRLADRIAVMKAGRIEQIGTPELLYGKPASLFVARLFSEINEIAGVVANGSIETPAGTFPAGDLADGTAAIVGIRERSVALGRNGAGMQPGFLPGRVRDLKFLGDVTRLEVAVAGFEHPIKVRTASSDTFATGSEVSVGIDRASALVFPAETANGSAARAAH